MSDDEWQGLGAIAAMVVEKMAAPDTGEESVPSAGTQAAGRQGRAQHNGETRGGAGAVVIQLFGGDGRVTSRPQGMHANRVQGRPGDAAVHEKMNPLAKRPARTRR